MVFERAEIVIKTGMMDDFLTIFAAEALPLTGQFTGCRSFRALRGVEDPNNVMFLAEWDSVEAHLASRPEPAHERFRQVVRPFVERPVGTVHFDLIGEVIP